jgi:hypothetical protein
VGGAKDEVMGFSDPGLDGRDEGAVLLMRFVAGEPDAFVAFYAENVARHIFGLLWPNWLCARPRDGAAVHGVR